MPTEVQVASHVPTGRAATIERRSSQPNSAERGLLRTSCKKQRYTSWAALGRLGYRWYISCCLASRRTVNRGQFDRRSGCTP